MARSRVARRRGQHAAGRGSARRAIQRARVLTGIGLGLLLLSFGFPWLQFVLEGRSGNETEFSAYVWGRRTIHEGPTVGNPGEAFYQWWFEAGFNMPGTWASKAGLLVYSAAASLALVALIYRNPTRRKGAILRWAPSLTAAAGFLPALVGFYQQHSHAEEVQAGIGGLTGPVVPLPGIALPALAVGFLGLPAWLAHRQPRERPTPKAVATSDEPSPASETKPDNPRPRRKPKKALIMSGSIVVVAILGLAAFAAYQSSRPEISWHAKNERQFISSEGFTQVVGVERDSTIGFEFDSVGGALIDLCVETTVYEFGEEPTVLGCLHNAPGGRKEHDVESGHYSFNFKCAGGGGCEIILSIWEKPK